MSVQSSTEFDPAKTLDLWIYLPPAQLIHDRDAWIKTTVQGWAHRTGANAAVAPRVEAFLVGVLATERLAGYTHRFVFLMDPDFGATVFDVTLAQDTAWPDLVSSLSEIADGNLGVEAVEFTMNDLTGVQSVQFELEGDSSNPERAISAIATVAVPRVLDGVGGVILIARSVTLHLESLVTSLVPMQYLLTSVEIEALLAESF